MSWRVSSGIAARSAACLLLIAAAGACGGSEARSAGAEAPPDRTGEPAGDLAAAADECDRAASCLKLADRSSVGAFSDRDYARAATMYEAACERGSERACAELSMMLYEGRGVARKRDDARAIAEASCERGGHASCVLALLSDPGEDALERLADLAPGLRADCRSGQGLSCVLLAHSGHDDLEPSAAARACEQGYEAGCEREAHRLDLEARGVYERCPSVEGEGRVDPGACLRYLEEHHRDELARSRSLRDQSAQIRAASCERNHPPGCSDPEASERATAAQCRAGDYLACASAGRRGGDASLVETACERAIGDACGALGDWYRDGEHVKRDLARAEAFYRAGCEAGDEPSCQRLEGQNLGAGCQALDPVAANPALGAMPAPLPTQVVATGEGEVRLVGSPGQLTLIFVTASWEHQAEPILEAVAGLARDVGSDRLRTVVVLADLDDVPAAWGRLLETFDAVIPDPPASENEVLGPIAGKLGVLRIPETLLVDDQGVARFYFQGFTPWAGRNGARCIEDLLGE